MFLRQLYYGSTQNNQEALKELVQLNEDINEPSAL